MGRKRRGLRIYRQGKKARAGEVDLVEQQPSQPHSTVAFLQAHGDVLASISPPLSVSSLELTSQWLGLSMSMSRQAPLLERRWNNGNNRWSLPGLWLKSNNFSPRVCVLYVCMVLQFFLAECRCMLPCLLLSFFSLSSPPFFHSAWPGPPSTVDAP